jgi:hypothetical protein
MPGQTGCEQELRLEARQKFYVEQFFLKHTEQNMHKKTAGARLLEPCYLRRGNSLVKLEVGSKEEISGNIIL